MSKIGSKVKIFSALEVANICGVVNQTAINWIKSGFLKAFTTPGGQYRVYANDLAAFLETRRMKKSGEVLQVLMEKANWNALLIAAEETINHKLKNELGGFLPNFLITQAFDGFDLGLGMARGKPGFLLLDQDLPGVNLSNLLRLLKTDPAFGRPVVYFIGDSPKITEDFPDSENLIDRIFCKPVDSKEIYLSITSKES